MRALLIILLLTGGLLVYTSIEHDDVTESPQRMSPFDAPRMEMTAARKRLEILGTTASSGHEKVLLQLATDHFGQFDVHTEFQAGLLVGDGWDTTSGRLLYALAAMNSANAHMDSQSIEIRGVTSDPEALSSRLVALRESLRPSVRLETDIVVVTSSVSLDELCQKAFSELIFEPISFRQSSAELRPGSFVTLDRITEFAHDCPGVAIAITGHSDASGDEAWNRQLSLARAKAVADHITARGIDAKRFIVNGRGSADPIADNSTPHGRELNRRIEFELKPF